MDLVKLLSKLQAISEADEKADKDYDKDGKVESEKDEVWGSRMKAAEKSKANEDIEKVLRGLMAIQEAGLKEDDVEEGNEFAKKVQDLKAQGAKPGTKFKTSDGKEHVLEASMLDECGMDMPVSVDTEASPLTMMGADGAEMQDEPEVAAPESAAKDRYTLTITKADGSMLNATTDAPEEITALMKAIGLSAKATVAPVAEPKAGEEVEEEFGNTPNATNERNPSLKGQTKDWGLPGTAKAKTEYTPAQQGDNPMAESMFKEYLRFKEGK